MDQLDQARFIRQVERLWASGDRRASAWGGDLAVGIGLELREPGEPYDWHGLRRGGDPARPYVVVQHTLSGAGRFVHADGTSEIVGFSRQFCAVVPDGSRYCLDGQPWRFLWAVIHHPYAVSLLSCPPAVLAAPADGAIAAALIRLIAEIRLGHDDRWGLERAIVELALCRAAASAVPAAGADLLARVRAAVLARLDHPPSVAELAAEDGVERSAWAHRFRSQTGCSPARWMLDVRLEAVRRRLAESADGLAEIAAASGFADANHLCKVFRRHHQQSPGAYRRSLGN